MAQTPAPDSATRYEAAIDAIDQEVARITAEHVRETRRETNGEPSSRAISEYLESCVSSLILLKQYLGRRDTAAIDAILDGSLILKEAPKMPNTKEGVTTPPAFDPAAKADPVMRYVLALEDINMASARMSTKCFHEEDRENPSPAILAYLNSRTPSLYLLEQHLRHEDTVAIDAILKGFLFPIEGPRNA
ncbi:MAG: hypothetical protein LBE22_00685 [Azoarcus sp.]|jgi:hypothetical protein|nr:hypothetical protein [Azoarcus sp.]